MLSGQSVYNAYSIYFNQMSALLEFGVCLKNSENILNHSLCYIEILLQIIKVVLLELNLNLLCMLDVVELWLYLQLSIFLIEFNHVKGIYEHILNF